MSDDTPDAQERIALLTDLACESLDGDQLLADFGAWDAAAAAVTDSLAHQPDA